MVAEEKGCQTDAKATVPETGGVTLQGRKTRNPGEV